METLFEPSKFTEPVISPVNDIVLAVANFDAVEALPDNEPMNEGAVKLPVKVPPVKGNLLFNVVCKLEMSAINNPFVLN
ncbi:hypothetical protein [Gaoshiqia sediminis]|uniref:Uncharacterized protein n=1 Tax=Gaoshiqia sediminis TaxID=2986998 RepID=A0AA42C9Y5_9BACT|nr:hypothetical protein [Gaoshiqia sediminis]MCW0484651.1 hypothetical protein [Gaoshiqia sediminis]